MSESGYEMMWLTDGYRGIKGKEKLLEVPWEASQRSVSFVLFWSVLPQGRA